MKIGVISDVHSNVVALKACIDYMEAEGCEEYLFLGDYVSDTPYTRETLDYLYEFIDTHTCQLLRGNREEYMLNHRKAVLEGRDAEKWIYNSACGNLLFTYELLTEDDLDFFDNLPISFDYEKHGYPTIKCCHGSPVKSNERIPLDGEAARKWFEKIDANYLLCGHTHYPGEYSYGDKHYFNSGSVGIAINDAGLAQCIILEDITVDGKKEWKPSFLKIPFDNKQVVNDIVESGLLEKAPWFVNTNIQVLLTGEDNSYEMVECAAQLAEEAGEIWPLVDDKYFAIAAEKYNIHDYREEYGLLG